MSSWSWSSWRSPRSRRSSTCSSWEGRGGHPGRPDAGGGSAPARSGTLAPGEKQKLFLPSSRVKNLPAPRTWGWQHAPPCRRARPPPQRDRAPSLLSLSRTPEQWVYTLLKKKQWIFVFFSFHKILIFSPRTLFFGRYLNVSGDCVINRAVNRVPNFMKKFIIYDNDL